jgi:hypothetical protein
MIHWSDIHARKVKAQERAISREIVQEDAPPAPVPPTPKPTPRKPMRLKGGGAGGGSQPFAFLLLDRECR